MRRWLFAAAAALAGGSVAAGLLGLGEAASQWLRFGSPAELPDAGPLRLLAPPYALHGWFGLAIAAFAFPIVALLAGWRVSHPRRLAWSASVGAAGASIATIWLAYVLREHVAPDWWAAHGAYADKLLLLVFWLGGTGLAASQLARVAARLSRLPAWSLAVPFLALLAATAPWPAWRAQLAALRTRGLSRTEAPASAPCVVLVTIDAWRRDQLSAVDPLAPPTPNLDALAAEGALCTNAWTPSPWTLPAMGSLMTGLTPRALSLRQYLPLPRAARTLAQIAWERGWTTTAFATNPYLSPWYGFDRGFADYEHSQVLEPLLPADRCLLAREARRYADLHYEAARGDLVLPKALAWLRRHGRERPFFLWVHLLDPHLPYTWRDLPAGAASPGRAGTPPDEAAVPDAGFFRGRTFSALHEVRDGVWTPDAADRRAIRTLYAREVQFCDAWLGILLGELKRLGLWERTVVAVTADHGEELFDHGGFEHGHSLLPEVTGIPLLVKLPAGQRAGTVVRETVSLLDLVPTLCAAAGWPAPPALAGRDIGRLLRGGGLPGDPAAAAPRPPLVLENMLYGSPQVALLDWPWLSVAAGADGEGPRQWYDLAAAPPAATAPAPARADSLLRIARRIEAAGDSLAALLRPDAAAQLEIPEHVRRQLRSLGY